MNKQLINIMLKWLKEANYEIDFKKFEISLISHPDYGGLTSVTDTLTEFGIENTAAQLPFEVLPNLTEPFIAYIEQDHQQQFALLYPHTDEYIKLFLGENKTKTIAVETLKALWTGNIVVVEKKTRAKKIWLTPYLSSLAYATLPILLMTLHAFSNPTLFSLIFFILSQIGLWVCIQIVNHQLGLTNGILTKFCTLSKNTSCDSVLNSKAAKLSKSIGLSDIGIVYFASQISIHLLSGSLALSTNGVQYLISICATPFVAYSLYLQKFIIKKWCPLCLGVVAILFMHSIIGSIAISWAGVASINIYTLLLLLSVTVTIVLLWKLLFPVLKASATVKELTIESLSFRRNYHLLLPYLRQQPSIQTDFDFDIIEIGNSYANNQLVIITNPLCESCIKLHTILKKLIAIHNNLSVRLIFYVPLNNNDPRTVIAGHLLTQNSKTENALTHDWYSNPNPKIFLKKYGNKISQKISTTIQQQKSWCHANNIYVTPTIIINGKRFPTFYRPYDIEYLLAEMLQASTDNQNVEASNTLFVDNR
jgi:uncharacterized membrane protein